MDPFTHSLVGLTAAKAGLDRLSPWATTVCVLAANSPDSDIIVGLTTDRWNYLHHHRGITHSIVGVVALAIIVPSLVYFGACVVAAIRKRPTELRYRGLLIASAITTATHPLMDWTNNYGVRPFLPWSARWFYGDLVFIVDPYIWLTVGGAAFLAASNRWAKIAGWSLIATVLIIASFVAASRPGVGVMSLQTVRIVLPAGILVLALIKWLRLAKNHERKIAAAALCAIALYWGGLALVHRSAYKEAAQVVDAIAATSNERVLRVAAMPTLANPFRWACVAETDRAIYRYSIKLGDATKAPARVVDGYLATEPGAVERFEKPDIRDAALISQASQDRRAEILLGFARFPVARVQDEDCVSQTLVQFADLRYTEPGAGRGTFSLNVPVECASK
jgi:inner membrane protein